MRFFENGPSIPDELLVARDEGRVVFFCGAGVSRARAGLSDFFGLAESVIGALGISADHEACKLLGEAKEIAARKGFAGLISADRIFGLLERDFPDAIVESAVAKALKPKSNVDLSAHRTLLQLATTPTQTMQLVTTNFDRLFNDCDNKLLALQRPRLPDPSRQDEFDGIIYLHGRANIDYDRSEGDGFVLSSAEFGRAYLSDGWATRFFRDIIERYVVVFVGYSADDPPVQYLLEALNKSAGELDGIYAFQSGTPNDAAARWQHKGVRAIAYPDEDAHSALWRTLEAWAERAKDSKNWRQGVLERAKQGPQNLRPYERGQVAHIVYTVEGASELAEDKNPLGAEWLCVFDPHRRYARPQKSGGLGSKGPYVDPFDCYGLDSDFPPARIAPDDYQTKRSTPADAWDCFATNRLDRINLVGDDVSLFRGESTSLAQVFPPRLSRIAWWVGKVSDQPAAVWWAAHQFGLHPVVQRNIRWRQDRSDESSSPIVTRAWRYLFEAWEAKDTFDEHSHAIESIVNRNGWDSALVRRFGRVNRPRLTVARSHRTGVCPPPTVDPASLDTLLELDVAYPPQNSAPSLPDEWLPQVVNELRKNLELAVTLENEIGGWGLVNISPLIPDESPTLYGFRSAGGLSGAVRLFVSHFKRLVEIDIDAASREWVSWPTDDDAVFSRLRIWTSGNPELVSAQGFGEVFTALSDYAFWSSYHQRDLLMTLAKRWAELPSLARQSLEQRLLDGPLELLNFDPQLNEQYRASASLSRLTWLVSRGCTLAANVQIEMDSLKTIVPDWKPEYADKAADSMESHGGIVKIDTEHATLVDEPLANVLSKALDVAGRSKNFLVKKAPFAGLAVSHPVRAFRALVQASKRHEFPLELWRQFLDAEARTADRPKFIALIAERLSRFPLGSVDGFLYTVSSWLLKASGDLIPHFPESFHRVALTIIDGLRSTPNQGESGIMRGNAPPQWVMEAINAPAGKLTETLWKDPKTATLCAGDRIPQQWRNRLDDLLALSGDVRQHVLVILAGDIDWLYCIDPNWTEENLLTVLDCSDEQDQAAFWSGLLRGKKMPSTSLYLKLKEHLLEFARAPRLSQSDHENELAAVLLVGWGSVGETNGQRYISSSEMREVLLHAGDAFRSSVLWHLETLAEQTVEPDHVIDWKTLIPELVRDAWPLQKSARTSKTSAALVNLLLSDAENMAKMTALVLPLLTTIDRADHLQLHTADNQGGLASGFPNEMLDVLVKVLPDKAINWPYDTDGIIARIGEANKNLLKDKRLVELMRQWNSR